ncbi:lytic transglycosylase domain-containing protein [Acinetobacter bereziniae]|uniref:lytic transglycosylase domain-containing protein n=1 Tax=Acinetobacter bereziniae TaxID=106648 RepID=UPI00157FC1FA|nr:lytic transglycosylase domain-containing protein [Acinetobacter bereziniae]NUF61541.1 lytic transglycosylase domain-containing protein [Acinetobacter bereziniae]NUG06147.1 lytic transglycosylase domain-containing protein [Acinetobacter bereziniae]NUG62302.1 lytic transglycosylase domain-containing protein [Acinetobacter bereziniae]NUG69196.1 lytic transglycosylase domain-containing protein [Acinetobacter bereziniae]NUG78510.1 lytic transglycosylase domain-containing protein [Acinetobacter b
MSNWLSEYSGEDQQQVDAVNAKGLTRKPTIKEEPSLFSGAATAVPRGLVAGAVKVVDTVAKPFERIADHVQYATEDIQKNGIDGGINLADPSFSEVHEEKNKVRNQQLVSEIEQLQDIKNTGTVGNILFSLGDYATRATIGSLAAGPVGAIGVTGLSETNYSFEELTNKGVDSETALKTAAVDGAVAGVSAALPISYGMKGTGGLIKDAALSIGGATALSTAGQYASGQILENSGYKDQAKKYEVTGESVATDLLLNALLFGGARGVSAYKAKLDVDVANEINNLDIDQIEAKETQIQANLVKSELEFEQTLSPRNTTDPVQQNNHLINLDTAVDQIKAGRQVQIPREVKGEDKKKPVDYETMNLPANAKLIARKARQDGVDPSVALTISHIETGGLFSSTAKNPDSSAHGVFQLLDDTWKGQGGGNRNDVNEQIKQGLKHIKNANSYMRKKLDREPVQHEQYLGHLLGPAGAVNVLKADPNASLIDIVRKYDSKNAEKIVNNNGMKGLTVGQAISKWEKKWNSLSSRYGGSNTVTAHGLDGSSYDFAYEVKSLSDLIASNDQAYGVNPNYPSELQPRDRTREASRQQIEDIANDIKPEWLGESYKLSDGAPIIGMDNVVESGNGRTLAISKAYEQGKGEAYRQFVQDFANTRGLNIEGINNPVLVRTRLTDTDRVEFAKLANQSDVAQFSSTERAVNDADKLPDSSLLKINNDGTINLDQSMDYIRGFVDQLPQSERANAITSDGKLSQDGKRRIESAIVQHAYNDPNLVKRLSENLDDDSKTVLNALLRAAPQLSQLNDLVKQGGRHQNTISSDLAQAVQKYSDLKANGLPVQDYLNQGSLFDDGLSPGAKDFLNVFDTNNRSAKAIGENIQSKINEVENMGDPRQGTLFGDSYEEKAALDIIMQNPDQLISVSRTDPQGNIEEITMTLRERLDELEAEAKMAEVDITATQAAISCALQFG